MQTTALAFKFKLNFASRFDSEDQCIGGHRVDAIDWMGLETLASQA